MPRLAPLLAVAVASASGGCAGTRAASPPAVTDPLAAADWPDARPDPALRAAVGAAVDGFDGVVGVYVRHLPTGRTAELRADETFPTASLVKVPILVGVFDRIERGDLGYRQPLVFDDPLRYGDDGLFSQLQDGATVALHVAAEQMVSASDNTASLWLQALAGPHHINDWLSSRGFAVTRVNSRTPGREADYARWGWGQTTPREMATLVQQIVEGRAVSPAADLEMHRLLTRTHYDDEAISAIPPSVQVASKQGAVMESRSEVAYVHAPSGAYVLCVVTRDQGDLRYEPDNAGYELIRTVSRLLWDAFEPGADWRPPPGSGRFRS